MAVRCQGGFSLAQLRACDAVTQPSKLNHLECEFSQVEKKLHSVVFWDSGGVSYEESTTGNGQHSCHTERQEAQVADPSCVCH